MLLLFPFHSVVAKNVSVGIYAIVDEVTLQPEGDSPEFIRISGIFVIPVSPSSGDYRSPQRGSLYFRVSPGMELWARTDWKELKRFAGSGKVVGFGQYWLPDPSDPSGILHRTLDINVYPEGSDAAAPDLYPIPRAQGVVEVTGSGKDFDPNAGKIAAQLRDAVHH